MTEPTTTPANAIQEGQETPAQASSEPDWKAEARKWEQRAKDNATKLREATPQIAELAQIKQERMTVEQRQAEQLARLQSENERWRTTAVGSRVEALAAVDFADPSDAALVLTDLSKYLDAAGNVDDNAIRADLAAVLERKPKWRKQDDAPAGPRLPFPNPAQGSGERPSASSPNDLMNALIRSHRGGQ